MNVEINGYRGSPVGYSKGPDTRQAGQVGNSNPSEKDSGPGKQAADEMAASEELKAELKRRQGIPTTNGVNKVENAKEIDSVEATRKRDVQRTDNRESKKKSEVVRR